MGMCLGGATVVVVVVVVVVIDIFVSIIGRVLLFRVGNAGC